MSNNSTEHRGGCLSAFFVFFCVRFFLFLFAVTLVIISAGSKSTSSAQKAAVTVTASATATPTAPMDDPIAWGRYAATKNMSRNLSLADVAISSMSGEKYLSIACNMDTMYSGKAYIVESAKFIAGVIPMIRDVQGFEHVTFLFYDTFVDKYGNTTQQLGMRAMYSRKTLQLINAEYFVDYAAANPYGIFNAADTSLIHPTYKD